MRARYGGRPTHPACLAAGTRSLDSGDLRLERLPCSHLWLTPGSQSPPARPDRATRPTGSSTEHTADPFGSYVHSRHQGSSVLGVPRQSPRHAHGNLSNSVHTLTDASATQCTREAQITGDLFLKVVVGECTLLICCCTRPTRPLGPFTRSRLSATRPTQPHSRAHSPRRSEWPSSSQPRRARWRQRWCRCQPHCPRHRPASLQTP